MTVAVHTTLRDYAAMRWPTINHKGRMTMLARMLGFGHRRIRSLYQNEPGVSIRAEEAARIAELDARAKQEATRADLSSQFLEARFAALGAEVADLRAQLARASLAGDR